MRVSGVNQALSYHKPNFKSNRAVIDVSEDDIQQSSKSSYRYEPLNIDSKSLSSVQKYLDCMPGNSKDNNLIMRVDFYV